MPEGWSGGGGGSRSGGGGGSRSRQGGGFSGGRGGDGGGFNNAIPVEFRATWDGSGLEAGVAAGAVAVAALGTALAHMAKEGDRANDVLARQTISVDGASEAAAGLVTELDLVIAANRAHFAGLKLNAEQYANLVRVAREYAEASGGEVTDAIETLTNAIIRGNERGLRPFGVQAGTTAEMLGQLDERARGLGPSIEGVGDAVTRLEVQSKTLFENFSRGIDNSRGLADAVGQAADGTSQMGRMADVAGQAVGDMLANLTLAGVVLQRLKFWTRDETDEMRELAAAARDAARGIAAAVIAGSSAGAAMLNRTGLTAGVISGGEDNKPVSGADEFRRLQGVNMDIAADEWRRSHQRGGGGGGPRMEIVASTEAELRSAQTGQSVETLEAMDKRKEQFEREDAAVAQRENVVDRMIAAEQRQTEAEARERTKREIAHEKEVEKAKKLDQKRLLARYETAAGFLRAGAQAAGALGASESAQNVIVGLSEEVLVAKDIAVFNYGGAALHQAAAVLAFANAAKQAAGGGGGSGGGSLTQGSRRGGGGGLGAGPGFGGGGASEGGGNVTIYMNFPATLAGQRDVQDAAVAAVNAAGLRGNRVALHAVER